MNRAIRLLMIVSGDTKFLEPTLPKNAWLKERHIAYGNRLGHLSMLVKTTGKKWPIRHLSEKVTVYPTNSANSLSAIWDLYREGIRIARRDRLNLIVTGDIFGCAWVAYALKRRLGIPLALQMLGDFIDNPYWLKERPRCRLLNVVAKWLIQRADAVRVHGERVREKLIRRFGFPPEKVRAIPIPIQREAFLKVPEKKTAGKRVLWIGRLAPQKDLATFLRAVSRVLSCHPEARFRLIGEGAEEASAKALAETLKIDHAIEWVGAVPYERIPDHLGECDLFVLSSCFEDAPRVLVEAALAARPVVTTAVGGADEVVEDGKTGFIVPIGDDEALADRLSLFLSEPDKARAFGRAGRAFAETMWHFDTILEALSKWWHQAMHSSGKSPRQPVILVAESGSGFGGTAKYLYTLLSSGERQPGHLQILTYRSGPFLKKVGELGYPLFRIPVLRFPWFENFLKPTAKENPLRYGFGAFIMMIQLLLLVPVAALWLFWKRVRVIHLNNEIHSHLVLLLAARLAGCRVLCHLHGWRSWARLEKLAARFVHLYIGITHRGTDFYRHMCPKGRFVTVVNGVAFEQPNGTGRRNRIRDTLGLGEKDVCLGIIGRMIPEKGHDLFLETFQKIAQTGLPVHALLVGGTEGNGSFIEHLHRKVETLGIGGKVHFAGYQKETAPYMEAMDIVVSPSLIPESFGLGIAEAMAAGKPVVAHATGAVPELVQDRVTGLLVPPDQAGRLEEAILELIQDRVLAKEIGERGRDYVLKHFNIRENSRRVRRIYKVLLGESKLLAGEGAVR